MIQHWYDYLPAAWLMPEGRWRVILSAALIALVFFCIGVLSGGFVEEKRRRIIHGSGTV